jgi:glycosyltransferase involved in cell wall biosynthesis
VHALGASGLGYARARRRGAVAPLVFNPQGLEEFGATDPARAGLKRLAYRPLQNALREMAAAADRVLATDRVLEPIVRQHLGTPADRVRVIPNALDLAHIDAVRGGPPPGLLRAGVGATPADFVLLSVGRIEENKGLHVLARALGAADLPACRWVVVGDGPYRGRLQRTCQAVGLGERVSFAGRLPDADLHAWYEAADLFVHPTLYEGSSLVSLEAMAHRRALVATRAGGLPDKVVPGVNGWLVEPGDAGALAGAIREARSDRVRLARMGAEGRRLVEREFSWDVVIRKLRDVYDELTNDD